MKKFIISRTYLPDSMYPSDRLLYISAPKDPCGGHIEMANRAHIFDDEIQAVLQFGKEGMYGVNYKQEFIEVK